MKICIDPGHGIGNANGSPDGTYFEHEFNLDVAGRIQTHLERCGLDVIMTRVDGADISLSRRCKIANDAKADLFLSIHTNAVSGGWNTAEGWSAHVIKKGFGAEKAAEAIRAHAIPMLGCRDRGVRESNFQVLRDTAMPAVLIEHGFHTNKIEVEKLKSDAYRALCAESDARGVCDYFGAAWIGKPETQEKYITITELMAMGYTGIEF